MKEQENAPASGFDAGAIWAAALPGVFVVLWSTGFVAGKLGMPHAGPFMFLEIRYAVVIVLLAIVAFATAAPWPKRSEIPAIAIAGLLVQAGYLGGVFASLSFGVEAGVSALIAGLQPVLTAAFAGPLLGEKVSGRQWTGLAMGLAGVILVVRAKLGLGLGTPIGISCAIFAMLSLTFGTLWQKRYCPRLDLRTGAIVQFAASFIATAPLALYWDHLRVEWTPAFILALFWLCVVLSIGAISAMFVLIRRGKASEVASLFFLVPPTTALIAWAMFGETLDPISIVGMALVVAAVAMVTMKRRFV
jgi:drug/metabolite transporter (DMT)-like permease